MMLVLTQINIILKEFLSPMHAFSLGYFGRSTDTYLYKTKVYLLSKERMI